MLVSKALWINFYYLNVLQAINKNRCDSQQRNIQIFFIASVWDIFLGKFGIWYLIFAWFSMNLVSSCKVESSYCEALLKTMRSELTMFTSEMESILAMLMLIPTTTGGPEEKGKLGVTKALLFFLFFLNTHILKRCSNIKLLDKFSSIHPATSDFVYWLMQKSTLCYVFAYENSHFFFLPKMHCTLVQQLKYPHPQKDKKNHTEHKYKG